MSAITPKRLFRYFKASTGPLLIGTYDNHLWATDTYVLIKMAGDFGQALTDLLADYNLAAEPLACSVGQTIRRIEQDPINLAYLFKSRKLVRVRRFEIQGIPMYASLKGISCELWLTSDDYIVPVDTEKVALLEDCTPNGHWKTGDGPLQPLVLSGDSGVAGLLMPFRSPFAGPVPGGLDDRAGGDQ